MVEIDLLQEFEGRFTDWLVEAGTPIADRLWQEQEEVDRQRTIEHLIHQSSIEVVQRNLWPRLVSEYLLQTGSNLPGHLTVASFGPLRRIIADIRVSKSERVLLAEIIPNISGGVRQELLTPPKFARNLNPPKPQPKRAPGEISKGQARRNRQKALRQEEKRKKQEKRKPPEDPPSPT